MMGGFNSPMGWTWLFWALLILGIVLLAVLAVRFFSGGTNFRGARPGSNGPASGDSAATRILNERYAKGELSTEEYTERLRALGDNS